ncbi:MAG: hypothetical protein PHN88_13915 [Ignavibacteria bacterium]|nr:hypothetical protein [Ignavibacteria bacterium]
MENFNLPIIACFALLIISQCILIYYFLKKTKELNESVISMKESNYNLQIELMNIFKQKIDELNINFSKNIIDLYNSEERNNKLLLRSMENFLTNSTTHLKELNLATGRFFADVAKVIKESNDNMQEAITNEQNEVGKIIKESNDNMQKAITNEQNEIGKIMKEGLTNIDTNMKNGLSSIDSTLKETINIE